MLPPSCAFYPAGESDVAAPPEPPVGPGLVFLVSCRYAHTRASRTVLLRQCGGLAPGAAVSVVACTPACRCRPPPSPPRCCSRARRAAAAVASVRRFICDRSARHSARAGVSFDRPAALSPLASLPLCACSARGAHARCCRRSRSRSSARGAYVAARRTVVARVRVCAHSARGRARTAASSLALSAVVFYTGAPPPVVLAPSPPRCCSRARGAAAAVASVRSLMPLVQSGLVHAGKPRALGRLFYTGAPPPVSVSRAPSGRALSSPARAPPRSVSHTTDRRYWRSR
jgi:hypothetical protein